MDERTPLLENDPSKVDLLYDRFSPEEKKLIVAIVSWEVWFLVSSSPLPIDSLDIVSPVFTSGTFIPSIPQIAKELGTTGESVRYDTPPIVKVSIIY